MPDLRLLTSADNDDSRELKERVEYSRTVLQLLVEFWLGANKPSTKDTKLRAAVAKDIPMSSLLSGKAAAGGKKPLEFKVLPELCYSAIKEFVLHFVSDPWISRDVVGEEDNRFRSSSGFDRTVPSTLTSALIAVQQPLYEFLKLSFTEWPFNETNTPFLSVVEIWLAYIELWNLPEHKQETNDRQGILKW